MSNDTRPQYVLVAGALRSQITANHDIKTFTAAVEALIEKGYTPLGGVATTTIGNVVQLMQVLTLKKDSILQ